MRKQYIKGNSSTCFFRQSLIVLIGLVLSSLAVAGETHPLTLSDALSQAYAENPELAAAHARARAERALVPSQYAPENPTVGFMREKGLTSMDPSMPAMDSIEVGSVIGGVSLLELGWMLRRKIVLE